MMKLKFGRAALVLLSSLASASAGAQVVGTGASFPSQIYQRWAQRYQQQTQTDVRYTPTGSGEGVKQVSARSVDFGGSDTPLSVQALTERRLVQWPILVGGIVPVVNLPGVASNRLVLTGEVLADLMAGKVERWNDPRIAALNPSLKLPAMPVVRVVRNDVSGTTESFTRYLSLVSPAFRTAVVASSRPVWPGQVDAAEGNDGVVAALKAKPGAVTYVSFDRVMRAGLSAVALRNAAGQTVVASEASFKAAVNASDLSRKADESATLLNMTAPEAWPITQATYVLVDARPAAAAKAEPALRFLYWCFTHGDDLTRGTGFAPLPTAVQARVAGRFTQVRPQDGGALRYAAGI
jgi:phosphate transport system substrate-binding protein